MRYENEIAPAIENIPGFAYLQSEDYFIPYANSFFRSRFGEHKDRRCHEIFYNAKNACQTCQKTQIFRTLISGEQEWEAPDGRTYLVYDSPFVNSGKSPMLLRMGFDITDRKLAEEESRKARNLESLFVFARGIAHDFNNILTSILGGISLGRMIAGPRDRMFEILSAAEQSALQARDLVDRFLRFSKFRELNKKPCQVPALLSSAVSQCHAPDVRFSLSLPNDLWPADADEAQMVFAFVNLLDNARHALPSGGVIEVVAENVRISSGFQLPLTTGCYVKVAFRDQGRGIDRRHLPQIFDPYMTTREMGKEKGVGLGLTLCYAILRNHGGYITAESVRGQGTVFCAYIPAAGGIHDA